MLTFYNKKKDGGTSARQARLNGTRDVTARKRKVRKRKERRPGEDKKRGKKKERKEGSMVRK